VSRSTDRLAFALATPESLSRQYFRKVFDHLYITDAVPAGYRLEDIDRHRRATESDLEALSVCDFERDARRAVHSCPPFLGLLPHAGFPAAVLFGARTPSIRRQLLEATRQHRHAAVMRVVRQPGFPLLPRRVRIQAQDLPALRAIARASSIPLVETAPSWLLLSYAQSVETQAATLPWRPGAPLLNWLRDDFDVLALSFRGVSPETSLRLTRYRRPDRAHRRIYYLIDGERSAEVDPRWARYYMLHRCKQKVLQYDERLATILLPLSLPLPRLLARGLVACSGFVPQEVPARDGRRFRAFVQVPQSHAELLARKLGQELTRTRLAGIPQNIDD
jgi:hypothetical protein